MSYSYEDIVRGGKGNMSIIRFIEERKNSLIR